MWQRKKKDKGKEKENEREEEKEKKNEKRFRIDNKVRCVGAHPFCSASSWRR